MNTGVEILIQRMKDCPEDFSYQINTGGMSRWMRLVDHALGEELLTDEESKALKEALKETKRVRFTELVIKQLAGEDDAPSDEGKLSSSQLTGMTAHGGTGITSPYQNAFQAQQTQIAQHLNAHKLVLAELDKKELEKKEQLSLIKKILGKL